MSLSATLSNALSGLTAMSRASLTVSTNVANAQTEGYAPRSLQLTSATIGGGVRIVTEERLVDAVLRRDLQLASAPSAAAQTEENYISSAFDLFGRPEDPFSLTARVTNFESALITATANPESEAVLQTVLDAASALASQLNQSSAGLLQLREDADAAVATEITALNASLAEVARLNEAILALGTKTGEANALLDQRQRVVDQIAEQVSVRVVQNENGSLSLYSQNGLAMLESQVTEFEFVPKPSIVWASTLESGALAAITRDGQVIPASGSAGTLAGGRIEALFNVRDSILVDFGKQLDGLAETTISRFQDPSIDPTQLPGDPGLFTDMGQELDITGTLGLASRIAVNQAVDPSLGGDLWRLRSGIYASDPGATGDSAVLQSLLGALTDARSAAPETGVSRQAGLGATFDAVTSFVAQKAVVAEGQVAFSTLRKDTLQTSLLADGVDTDQELQKLLQIEQAYAANARVIQTADELMQILIGL